MMFDRDVAEIAFVQNSYGIAIDRRDWDMLARCFTVDAMVGFGRPPRVGTRQEFLDWAPAFHDALGQTLHQNSTHHATVHGDSANASCYLHAVLVAADGGSAQSIYGVYRDEMVRVGNAWHIRRREFRPVWRQTMPAST